MSVSLPPRRKKYNQYHVTYIFIHSLFRKLLKLTRLSLIELFTTLVVTILLFSLLLILIFLFSLSLILPLLTVLFLLLLLILYISLLLSESELDSIFIYDNNGYITIWYWTIFRNNIKIFIKNFIILKIFRSKFTEKIAFRKSMFQSRITIFSITTRTPFWMVFFNHFGGFGNTSIEFISITGTKYPSEANAKFRILEVEFYVVSSFLMFLFFSY